MTQVNMRAMLEAGLHFGHLARFREPKMNNYIFGVKNGISIINLEKALPLYKDALKNIKRIASNGGKILFVGTKRTARQLIAEYAEKCSMPYVNHRWLGGMLTNYKTIKQSIRRLNDLYKMKEDGIFAQLTKKEALTLERELQKSEQSLGGILNMGGLPDALFVIDVGQENIAVKEANRLGIPVFGVVDTNSKPDGVDYLIPGNDDAMQSIRFYLEGVSSAILEAKQSQAQKANTSMYEEEFVEVSKDAPPAQSAEE